MEASHRGSISSTPPSRLSRIDMVVAREFVGALDGAWLLPFTKIRGAIAGMLHSPCSTHRVAAEPSLGWADVYVLPSPVLHIVCGRALAILYLQFPS